ncbi:MAG TPA: SDR family NAD(P)-dependent oxidoreductase [Solirubrobacterales bacterium]|nr:SDR family NAD(P)-dependent oxidoreductase [Solirubrobacterales bacterium]
MSWGVADIPNLTGRTAVVTGANGGLGLETTRALAAAGAEVVIAARNQEKAAEAEADIRRGAPGAALEVVELDLGSLASVGEAAGRIFASHQTIDILVNNAGVMGIPERKTVDGFEMQFGVDHLGHFALTALLMPALLRADAARIVTVTSTAHHMGRTVDPHNPHLHGRYGPWRAYGQAKLANFHFALGLHQLLEDSGTSAASLVAHPGLSTPACRRSASRRPTAASRSASSTASPARPACRLPRERCRSCGRRPIPAHAAVSSTARSSSTTAPRSASRCCGGSAWRRQSGASGRSQSARRA